MSNQEALIEAAILTSSADFSEVEAVAGAGAAQATTTYAALAFDYDTTETIDGIVLRVKLAASADGFTPLWNTNSERLLWRVGSDTAQEDPTPDIPKTGVSDWVTTAYIPLQPNGTAAWTWQTINSLEVAAKVAWTAAFDGSVTLALSQAEVIVYALRETDVRVVGVGAGTPPDSWIGGTLHGNAVGATATASLPVRWVGEVEA